jgi:hypothetical protein
MKLVSSKEVKERLEEFLDDIFSAYDSSLTYNVDGIHELIEVSFKGYYDETPQYFSMTYRIDENNGKIEFETNEDHWVNIEAWDAKLELLMCLFLTSCWNFDYSKS